MTLESLLYLAEFILEHMIGTQSRQALPALYSCSVGAHVEPSVHYSHRPSSSNMFMNHSRVRTRTALGSYDRPIPRSQGTLCRGTSLKRNGFGKNGAFLRGTCTPDLYWMIL